MGMASRWHNYDAVMQATEILRDPNGLALSAERITLSTVGVVREFCGSLRKSDPCISQYRCTLPTQEERVALVPRPKNGRFDD